MAGAYFVGVPAPAGAVLAMLPIYVEFLGTNGASEPHGMVTAWVALAYMVLVAFLMVSRVPTFSGKHIGQRIPRDMVLPIFIAVVVFAALLVSFPWWVLTVGTILYLGVLPLSWRAFEATRRTVTGEPLRANDAPMQEVAEQPEPLRLEPPPQPQRSAPRAERPEKPPAEPSVIPPRSIRSSAGGGRACPRPAGRPVRPVRRCHPSPLPACWRPCPPTSE